MIKLPSFSRTLTLVALVGGVTFAAPRASAAECIIGFADATGLGLVNKHQAYGILDFSGGGLGLYNYCSSLTDWFYFDEDPATAYQHYHIGADNPSVTNCFTSNATYPDGVWGKLTGGVCKALDPLTVSRYVTLHQPDQWARFVDLSSSTRSWRPSSIVVKAGSAPLQIQFEDQTGQHWWWGPLNSNPSVDIYYTMNQGGLTGKRAVKAWVTRFNTVGGAEGSFDNVGVNIF